MRATLPWLVVFGSLAGCDDNPPSAAETSSTGVGTETGSTESTGAPPLEGTASIIDLAAFEKTRRANDPFDDRPADVQCEFGYGLEDGFFEIETDLCRHGVFEQRSLAAVRQGDAVSFLLLHENLVSDIPGSAAHVAIAFDHIVVFETSIEIPAEAGFISPTWSSPIDLPEGAPIHVHLHNHGINSYRIADLSVTYR